MALPRTVVVLASTATALAARRDLAPPQGADRPRLGGVHARALRGPTSRAAVA
jgi:hypothetical protein